MTDGRLGMINQCRGLATVLSTPAVEKIIELSAPWCWLPPAITPARLSVLAKTGDRLSPPWPDLLIGTGRKSVAPLLAVKRASGGRSFCVQVQNPDVALEKFDLVIAPEHDQLRGDNVLSTLGSMHGVTAAVLDDARALFADAVAALPRPLIAVLLGGNNAVYRMDENLVRRLADDLATLAGANGCGLAITASPRTPREAVAVITKRLANELESAKAVFWDGAGANPYLGYLAHADAILVTADSVNMVSEAAATGKPVHVIDLPGGSDKFRRFHTAMVAAGITRPFTGAIEHWSYVIPDDTARAAAEIRRRMSQRDR
ncbi:MAG: mitochondrial fission ELM1 family protein [Alphaproteobacteria bacterium]|nr:mitochondrial fission ELM1 family protein [Alphaproteobacteria bacterium]MCZ6591959.1 mitochondrial fission ELM1 family protein [Alphaproteobacteria bacterium]